jgi:hypothetical protein
MKDVCGMVHTILKGPVEMREGASAAAEPHTLAKVISTLFAVIAVIAHDTSFNCDPLAWYKIFHAGTDSGHYAPRFVTQHEWRLYREVAIPPIQIVMYCMLVSGAM